jgi:1-aminocyclopropane-1-carboxylate deaminase/D-cysteine desulfhydrase-like pyridoxal-dependent ACC family enzyme
VRAYAEAAHEFLAQRPGVDAIFVADGSGGTHAGLLAGFASAGPHVIGVDVGTRPHLAEEVQRMSGVDASPTIDVDHVGPGYGVADDRTVDALRLAARTEGLLLDPVYTGKAMAALITWTRDKKLGDASRVCFWHTGGQPALFAARYQPQLRAR